MEFPALKAVVLAAGKGTRMRTDGCDLPKVMRTACGRPLLHYVLGALDFIAPADTVIVVGYRKQTVMDAFPGYVFAEQAQQLVTGHAVMAAFAALGDFDGDVLVCCGDMPLIRRETYQALCRVHRESGALCTMLTGSSDVPLPYGRILRDASGRFVRVIEERDCTPEQRSIDELNCGVYVFRAKPLAAALGRLRCSNAQGEYYLTDVPALLQEDGFAPAVCHRSLGQEIIGVNTPEQLAAVEQALRARA